MHRTSEPLTRGDCASCRHHYRGPLSGLRYCRALPVDDRLLFSHQVLFAHQMRLPDAPCGPQAALFEPAERRDSLDQVERRRGV